MVPVIELNPRARSSAPTLENTDFLTSCREQTAKPQQWVAAHCQTWGRSVRSFWTILSRTINFVV